MTGGVPCTKTYKRVFAIIDSKELESIFTEFLLTFSLSSTDNDIINLDGRVNRGSTRNETGYNDKVKPLNILNAYSNKYGICLAGEQIDDKTNEITAIPDILKRFDVKGNVITWDALNTQIDNVEAVVNLKGDYVVPTKGNQGNFYNDLVLYFDEKKLETIKAGQTSSAYLNYKEKRGEQLIHYEYYQTEDVKWYFDRKKWKKLNSIRLSKKTIETLKGTKVEYRYYISSLFLNIELFSKAIRNHWSVENKLHWHLDFTFKQDDNSTIDKNALLNLQILKKLSLAFLNDVKRIYNRSLRLIRFKIFIN